MTPERRNPGLPAILVAALASGALPAALAQTEKPATPPAPVRNLTVSIVPRAHDQSSYEFEGYVDLFTKDITFDTPPEYQESFAFWGDRMKGVKKRERIRYLTMTKEQDESGSIPFRKMASRYLIEFVRDGRPFEPRSTLSKDVLKLAWEGSLDEWGNVGEVQLVTEVDNTDIAQLNFPLLNYLFPRLEGPRDLEVGESFTDTNSIPLPTQLTIRGLEQIRVLMTRTFVLKEVRSGKAEFEVETTYAADPEWPSTEPSTTCVISGGGRGRASFDLQRGLFVTSKLPTRMVIDIEAPLRRLSGMDEGETQKMGKTNIDLFVTMSGGRKITRLFGEEPRQRNRSAVPDK